MPIIFAAVLTCLIICPMFVLSAEFGYKVTHELIESIFFFSSHIAEAIRDRDCNIRLNIPCEMKKMAEFIRPVIVLLIISQSYAPWVQFNIDTLGSEKTNNLLSVLNPLTIVGALIFNFYVINNISNEWICRLFQLSGDINLKKRAEFHEFGCVVINLCKKMPDELLNSSLEEIFRPDSGSEEILQISF
jgi:hypothetical protein